MNPFRLLFVLPILLASCTTPPIAPESQRPAVSNASIGFYGYSLYLADGYVELSAEDVATNSNLQALLGQRRMFLDRIRLDPMIKDQRFLWNGNRLIWFSVEEVYTRIPLGRLADDRRKRVLEINAARFMNRAIRHDSDAVVLPMTYDRIGDHDLLRSELIMGVAADEVHFSVLGGLNELYHFVGIALEGEGLWLEKDIIGMIGDLSY